MVKPATEVDPSTSAGQDQQASDCSVGVMAYNEERNIGCLLEFLVAEMDRYEEVREVIVVASGCTDSTVSIVRDFARRIPAVKLYEESTRNGKASAVDLFVKNARYPICVLVNADTLPSSGSIRILLEPLRDQGVGMTGGRPVPVCLNRNNNDFWCHLGRILWSLHHQINLTAPNPKLGEFVAFRRGSLLSTGLEKTPTDEVVIEAQVARSGYGLAYVSEAVTSLTPPQTVRDFITSRRRIYCGHLLVAKRLRYVVPTISTLRVARILLAQREFLWPLRRLVYTLGAVALEALGRLLGVLDFIATRDHSIWDIAVTTKDSLGPLYVHDAGPMNSAK